jgi:hypothetical protein
LQFWIEVILSGAVHSVCEGVSRRWATSITKSVFSVYVMQLVERGEFQLDVPIARQLPKPLDSYEAYRVSASELVKDPAWATVTPRMRLSHSSGLLNFASLEPDKKMRLHFKPGSQFLYSGEGNQSHTICNRAEDRKAPGSIAPGGLLHAFRNAADRHYLSEGIR